MNLFDQEACAFGRSGFQGSRQAWRKLDSSIKNRYLTTVRIAFRAKQRRFDDFDGLLEESSVKPVQRAIIELSDEQDQPDLLPG